MMMGPGGSSGFSANPALVTPLKFKAVQRAKEEQVKVRTVRERVNMRRAAEEEERFREHQRILEEKNQNTLAQYAGKDMEKMLESSRAAYIRTHEKKQSNHRMMTLLYACSHLAVLFDQLSEDRSRRWIKMIIATRKHSIVRALNQKKQLENKKGMLRALVILTRYASIFF